MAIDYLAQSYLAISQYTSTLNGHISYFHDAFRSASNYLSLEASLDYVNLFKNYNLLGLANNDLPPENIMFMVRLFIDVIKTGSVLSIPIFIGERFIRIWHFRNNGGKTEYQIEDHEIRPGKSK